jgi:hypothetical protein
MTDELQFRPLEWPKAWVDALLERKRQVEVKHFDDKNDDAYPDGEMEAAACSFALSRLGWGYDNFSTRAFPWSPRYYAKMRSNSHRRNLVIAAALLLAAIERLDRKV